MTLKELLQITLGKDKFDQYTLLIRRYGTLEGEFIPREYFVDTPIFDRYSNIDLDNYIVLVPFFKAVDVGRNWKNWSLQTIVVTTRAELEKELCNPQLDQWLLWLDKQVRKEVSNYEY